MRIAIVYHSGGGNTHALMKEIAARIPGVEVFRIKDFDISTIPQYDGLIVGTYTWANGDIPAKMIPFYEELEIMDIDHIVTGVFGTGETGYRYFCGAVDLFRDLLYEKTNLAVTLKVEQLYQQSDLTRVDKFCELFMKRLNESKRVS